MLGEVDDSTVELDGGSSIALQVYESALLAESTIIEYLVHQSIVLRLDNLYPADPLQPKAVRLANLQRAHHYSEIIQSTPFTFGIA